MHNVPRPPDLDSGEAELPNVTPITFTDHSKMRKVTVLPGESLADLTKRVFGANTPLNRAKIVSNNTAIAGEVWING